MLFTKSTKQPLPPKCIVAAIQQQMDWAGSNAPIALAALHDHSKITEFYQAEELPVGSVVMDRAGSVLHKVKPDLWEATGSTDHWCDTGVVLPAHVLTWENKISKQTRSTHDKTSTVLPRSRCRKHRQRCL